MTMGLTTDVALALWEDDHTFCGAGKKESSVGSRRASRKQLTWRFPQRLPRRPPAADAVRKVATKCANFTEQLLAAKANRHVRVVRAERASAEPTSEGNSQESTAFSPTVAPRKRRPIKRHGATSRSQRAVVSTSMMLPGASMSTSDRWFPSEEGSRTPEWAVRNAAVVLTVEEDDTCSVCMGPFDAQDGEAIQ